MSSRLLCLLVLVCIAVASLCLVPVGHGPFSVVYGPKTAFRAYRASLQVMQAVAAIVIVGMAQLLAWFDSIASKLDPTPEFTVADTLSLISSLRC